MAAPIALLALVAAAVGLALAGKHGPASTTPTTTHPGGAPVPVSAPPSYPGAAGALNSAAGSPAPVSINPAPPPPPPSPIALPPVFVAPGTVTLPPITITGTPVAAPPATDSGGNAVVPTPPVSIVGSDGTAGLTAPWDSNTMVLPDPSSLPAIPAKYATKSQETYDVQDALNAWASAVGFQAVDANGNNLIPLNPDSLYGHDTQLAAAGFQVYSNATRNAGLTVDGLAGSETQTYLLDWGSITSGAYS